MVANFCDTTTLRPSIFMASMNILRTLEGRIHYCHEGDYLTLIHWSLFQQEDGTANWEPITSKNREQKTKRKFLSKTCDTEGKLLKRQNT
jgi:hypothetical protein